MQERKLILTTRRSSSLDHDADGTDKKKKIRRVKPRRRERQKREGEGDRSRGRRGFQPELEARIRSSQGKP